MKCTTCGAPVTPGITICEYCGSPLDFGPDGPPVGTPGAGPAPNFVPAGSKPAAGGAGTGGTARALAPDGAWYPVACSGVQGNMFLVRFNDGRQATIPQEEVRRPCDPSILKSGARILGEYEGHYYPGTIQGEAGGVWTVQFDDGEKATLPADRLAPCNLPQQPIPPGTQVLAQSPHDGGWYSGRVMSGPDQTGRQRVRIDSGEIAPCTRAQINGPAGPDLLQQGRRVMGIGPDGMWYPGTVKQVAQGQCYIRFDDNEEAWVMLHEVRCIC